MKNGKCKGGIEVVIAPIEWPRKKTFRLDERQAEGLKKIMADYGFTTENEAIGYVLETYSDNLQKLRLEGDENYRLNEEFQTLKSNLEAFKVAANQLELF